jgi:hypothetical protein
MLDSGNTSNYTFEKEVLLFPFFNFRVIDITQTPEKNVKCVLGPGSFEIARA